MSVDYVELRDPIRDTIGLALAYADQDDERLVAILEPYEVDAGSLQLLLGVLNLVGSERNTNFADWLEQLALGGAGHPVRAATIFDIDPH